MQRFRSEVAEDLIVDKGKCTGSRENLIVVRPRELPQSSMTPVRQTGYTRYLDNLPR